MEDKNQDAQQPITTDTNKVEENPQQGDKWSNYQTKELAGAEGKGESAEEAAEVFLKEQP